MPPVPARQMTPVQPRRGGQVHITSLSSPRRTACGKKCDGWRVALVQESHVDCLPCKAAVFLKVKR
jgi:hypothetical protein